MITDKGISLLSPLQRRLQYAAAHPDKDWIVIAENVPEYPVIVKGQSKGTGLYSAYGLPAGIEELREAIAIREQRTHGERRIVSDNVIITSGALHGIGLLLRILKKEQFDSLLVPDPVYRGIYDAAIDEGYSITSYKNISDIDAFGLTGHEVLYCNYPSNPSGEILNMEKYKYLKRIIGIGRIPLIFDAVYDSFVYSEEINVVPMSEVLDQNHVYVVNSFSKNYASPGLRIGWIVANSNEATKIAEKIDHEQICISTRMQYEALNIMESGNEELIEFVKEGRDLFSCLFKNLFDLKDLNLVSGVQSYFNIGVDDIEKFADFCLQEGLVISTSSNYYPARKSYMRFPWGLSRRKMVEALGRLKNLHDVWLLQ